MQARRQEVLNFKSNSIILRKGFLGDLVATLFTGLFPLKVNKPCPLYKHVVTFSEVPSCYITKPPSIVESALAFRLSVF